VAGAPRTPCFRDGDTDGAVSEAAGGDACSRHLSVDGSPASVSVCLGRSGCRDRVLATDCIRVSGRGTKSASKRPSTLCKRFGSLLHSNRSRGRNEFSCGLLRSTSRDDFGSAGS